jgi:glycosyltransferase involved in cell wall biosynthesis
MSGTVLATGGAGQVSGLAVVVLTYNEAKNIRHCLESVRDLAPVHVVDSGSNDGTVEICREYTDAIVQHPYANHASQWRWALENLPISQEWILALDADFVATAELKARIASDLAKVGAEVGGIYVRHLYRFGGGLIRFGGTKRYWLRLIRRGRATPDAGDLVDFRFAVEGTSLRWREAVLEYNRNDDDISVWLRKQDKFAIRLAVEEELRRRGLHGWSGRPRFFGTTDERFSWLRDRWLGLPLFVRPVAYFLYRYIFGGGFLDGRAGFLYHFLQGLWLRVIVDWKTLELRERAMDDEALHAFSRAMLQSRSGSVDEIAGQSKTEAS